MNELEARGVRTRATVVKIARGGATFGHADHFDRIDDPDATSRIRTTVRIATPSGETFECATRLTFRVGALPKVGDTVPVIYDADDHDVVEVDDLAHRLEMLASRGDTRPTTVIGMQEVPLDQIPGLGGAATAGGDMAVPGLDQDALADALAHGQQVMNDHLEQMRQLHAQGVLSDEQFEMIRRQMPGQI